MIVFFAPASFTKLLTVQFVECINISNQSLASTALGQKDTPYAFSVVKRHLVYATVLVVVMGGLLLTFHQQILDLFTPDSAVVATAWTVLPLVALALPLDAISTVADGTLTAAGCALPHRLSSAVEMSPRLRSTFSFAAEKVQSNGAKSPEKKTRLGT